MKENVLAFLEHAAALHGQSEANKFASELYSQCIDAPIASPIEQLFLVAFHALANASHHPVNPEFVYDKAGNPTLPFGIYITPQCRIGPYRADFEVSQVQVGPDDVLTPVIVELDGHDFHDKNKKQRSYEKARDRHLVKAGYRVVHYTGSDVVADPFAVAWEVLEMIGAFVGSGQWEYNPADPLGLNDA